MSPTRCRSLSHKCFYTLILRRLYVVYGRSCSTYRLPLLFALPICLIISIIIFWQTESSVRLCLWPKIWPLGLKRAAEYHFSWLSRHLVISRTQPCESLFLEGALCKLFCLPHLILYCRERWFVWTRSLKIAFTSLFLHLSHSVRLEHFWRRLVWVCTCGRPSESCKEIRVSHFQQGNFDCLDNIDFLAVTKSKAPNVDPLAWAGNFSLTLSNVVCYAPFLS